MLSKLTEDGIISKYQYAQTLKNYMNDDVISLDFSDEILNKLKLEEEQAILDTIKDIGKKRNREPNLGQNGDINMANPFGEVSGPIATESEIGIEEQPESMGEQNIDERESINNEENGEGLQRE